MNLALKPLETSSVPNGVTNAPKADRDPGGGPAWTTGSPLKHPPRDRDPSGQHDRQGRAGQCQPAAAARLTRARCCGQAGTSRSDRRTDAMRAAGTATRYNPFARTFSLHGRSIRGLTVDGVMSSRSSERAVGWWASSWFEDVRAAILDPDTFLSSDGMDIHAQRPLQQAPPGCGTRQPPTRRDPVGSRSSYFLPRRVRELRLGIPAVVRDLVDSWRAPCGGDLAWPMPFDVFFHVMGLPNRRGPRAARSAYEPGRCNYEPQGDRVPEMLHLTPGSEAATAAAGARSTCWRNAAHTAATTWSPTSCD